MRYAFILCLFVFVFTQSSAQFWLPFPPGQKSLYQYSSEPGSTHIWDGQIDTYEMDTVIGNRYLIHGTHQVYGCYSDSVVDLTGLANYNVRPAHFGVYGDTVSWNEWSFDISLLPGESHDMITSDTSGILGFRFECVSLEERSFAGVTDSVKVFSVTAIPGVDLWDSVVLSKHHGFIKFLNWQDLIEEKTNPLKAELVSLDKGSGSTDALLVPVTGAEFYPQFTVGDKLCWSYLNDVPYVTFEMYKFCDSLVTDLGSNRFDKVRIGDSHADTVLFDKPPWAIHPGMENVFSAPTSRWGMAGDGSLYGDAPWLLPYEVWNNTGSPYVKASIYWSGEVIFSGSCQANSFADWGASRIIDTYAGLQFYESWGIIGTPFGVDFFTTTYERIGSVVNGVSTGFTALYSGISETRPVQLKMYPNPAGNFIQIELPPDMVNATCFIYNITGALIKQQSAKTIVELAGLTSGYYIVQIESDDSVYTGRFVKE